jgi:hypothetical protein
MTVGACGMNAVLIDAVVADRDVPASPPTNQDTNISSIIILYINLK